MSKEVVTEEGDRKAKEADDKENKFWSVVLLQDLSACEEESNTSQKEDNTRKNGPITPVLFFYN